VGALTADEAARLARQLTPSEQRDEAFARSVAEEAGGSPFFVHELARHAVRAGRPPRLADVVDERVRSLPAAARGLITAIALSAQAIPDRVAEAAAGIAPDDRDPLRQLRAARLVRAPGHGDERALEPYHDRIREAVIAHVPPAALAGEHRRLADAWERSGLARPETLATHWLGAGDEERTARYAAQAAERATDTLAFDRAAGFYRLLVRLERDRAQQRRWRVALGESLVNAGRGHEAALVYLDALALTAGTGDAPGGRATDDREDDDVELERRAAAEFIRAGYLDEATAVLARLLPRVGVSPPTSQPRAFATLAAYRALLLVRGLGFRERREADVPAADLRRIDVLVAIGPPMALMSLPLGLSLHVQGTWHALRVGEPKRVAVGLALLVSTLSPGGTRTFARASALAARARALAERHDDAWTIARALLAEGICYKVSGYWTEGIERLERAIDRFTRCPGARWEIETAQTVRHDALIWTGDWRRLGGELAARWHDAEQRGDLYSAAHVAGRLNPLMLLAVDRPAEARAGAESAARHGNKPQHSMQQRAALCTWLDIELYDGRPAAAAARLKQSWRVLRGTLSLFQNGRIEAEFYRARIALALAARGERRFLTHAASSAKRLARERAGWAGALATLVRATLLYADGRTNAAVAELARAEQAFDACHMRLYAAAARYRRGRLTGSSDGAALADGARQSFIGEGVVNPERIIDLLAPGPW
jgi:tetratricopeptide (TPR) repeat protein